MRRLIKPSSRCIYLFIICVSFSSLYSYVGDVEPGQSLWCIDKRIANTTDEIESKIDVIESLIDILLTATCSSTPVTSADIVNGVITLSASGNYCLAEDVTTDIQIIGNAISLNMNNRIVTGTVSISSDDVEVSSGTIEPPAPTTAPTAAIPALSIASTAARVTVSNIVIQNADSTGDGINGRNGVEIDGDDIQFRNSTVIAGAASNAISISNQGGTGGSGVVIGDTANNVFVNSVLCASGKGGDGNSASGGDGGDGMKVSGPTTGAIETEIINCTILSTGSGGNGTGTGNGGDGGDGIFVQSAAVDTVVHGCTIRNTGSAGNALGSGTSGVAGKAALDQVVIVANLSFFYQNFAHNIANTIKFDLQGTGLEQGVAIANPPTSTVVNPYANVYIS